LEQGIIYRFISFSLQFSGFLPAISFLPGFSFIEVYKFSLQ